MNCAKLVIFPHIRKKNAQKLAILIFIRTFVP